MRSLLVTISLLPILAFSVLIAPTGCGTVGPIVDAGKQCAKVAGQDLLSEAIVEVNRVLGCSVSDPAAIPVCVAYGLGRLGYKYGKDVVLCALERIDSNKFVVKGDTIAPLRQVRAKAVLANSDRVFVE